MNNSDERDHSEESSNRNFMLSEGISEAIGHYVNYTVELDAIWEWRIYGFYDRTYVQRYIQGEKANGVYDQLGPFPSKATAKIVANALNDAYARGRAHELAIAHEIDTMTKKVK